MLHSMEVLRDMIPDSGTVVHHQYKRKMERVVNVLELGGPLGLLAATIVGVLLVVRTQ